VGSVVGPAMAPTTNGEVEGTSIVGKMIGPAVIGAGVAPPGEPEGSYGKRWWILARLRGWLVRRALARLLGRKDLWSFTWMP
jgi:hypothetical protein